MNVTFILTKKRLNYTYLGTRISSSGNFTLSLDHLREKALHALFALRRHVDFSSLKPSLACKIFDTMISPILTYNSEAWGVFAKSDFKSWNTSPIEKSHLPPGGLLGPIFVGYVPLASQNPCPIIVIFYGQL